MAGSVAVSALQRRAPFANRHPRLAARPRAFAMDVAIASGGSGDGVVPSAAGEEDFVFSEGEAEAAEAEGEAEEAEADPSVTPSSAPAAAPKGKAKGKAKAAAKKALCVICLNPEQKVCAKSTFCSECRRGVAACKLDSERNNEIEFYNGQAQRDDTFRAMILKYMAECPSKGSGVRRDAFDWARLQEELYRESRVIKGNREVMMAWPQFEQHWTSKKNTAMEIAALWAEALRRNDGDQDGDEVGVEDRVPVAVESYRLVGSPRANSATASRRPLTRRLPAISVCQNTFRPTRLISQG